MQPLTKFWSLTGIIVLLAGATAANFIRDPKCPPATPQLPAACAGRRSNCWSPGVRDVDCPGSGLCCYDGCANTCVGSPAGQPAVR
jgi:WAP-type (Whey Acidic Protein) 'four-disulfide core'